MATSRPASTFTEALRARDDDELVALLRARPDLSSPPPSTLRSLAARATAAASTERALAALARLTLQVLESVVALAEAVPGGGPRSAAAVVAALAPAPGTSAPELRRGVGQAVATLLERGLLWRDHGRLAAAPGVAPLLGAHPAALGPVPADGPRSAASLRAAVADVPAPARAVLDALTWDGPVGAAPRAGLAREAVATLLDQGLLVALDADRVALPADVGLALRGGRTHRDVSTAPPLPDAAAPVAQEAVDAEAAAQALEAVRVVADLLALWDQAPPTTLRTGGLAVRDLRRAAAELDVDEPTAAAAAELALAAGLVADDGEAPASFVPTTAADPWLAADDAGRWAVLARAWLATPRASWLAATRDEQGGRHAPLAPDLTVPWARRLRADVLAALRALGAPVPLDAAQLRDVLAWRTPRDVPPLTAVAGTLDAARLLGVVALGVLSTPGARLADDAATTETGTAETGTAETSTAETGTAETSTAATSTAATSTAATSTAGTAAPPDPLAAALDAAAPAPVDDLLVQGDLTGVVPGRPTRALATLLASTAQTESRGAALTVRFTPASVEQALAGGRGAEELLEQLAAHARGPLPQSLEYLVRDAARRHGRVRVGAALSYVRVDDPVLAAAVLAEPTLQALGVVRLGPTVLGASVPAARLHEALAAAGVGAVLEGPDGQPLPLAGERRRVHPGRRGAPTPGATDGGGVPRAPSGTAARRLVAALRTRDDAAREGGGATRGAPVAGAPGGAGPGATAGGTSGPADVLALLHEAVAQRGLVELETVDGRGAPVRRTVRPVRLDAGRLRAVDPARDAELTVAVHRIAAVRPL